MYFCIKIKNRALSVLSVLGIYLHVGIYVTRVRLHFGMFLFAPPCVCFMLQVAIILIEKSTLFPLALASCRFAFVGPLRSCYLSVTLSHGCLGGSIQTQAESGWHA